MTVTVEPPFINAISSGNDFVFFSHLHEMGSGYRSESWTLYLLQPNHRFLTTS